MNLSRNEIKILTVLQKYRTLSRLDLVKKTGIANRNISRYIKQIISRKFASSEMKKIPNTKTRESIITITSKGKKFSLDGIPEIEEKPTPKKIGVEAEKYIEWKGKKKPIKPKIPIKPKKPIEAKPLPSNLELKKEIRLLINLVLTHRKEEYQKYGYKSVSEIRSQIDTLIDQL